MSANLSDALADLIDRRTAMSSCTVDEAVKLADEVASDWELNPTLLIRKFSEKTAYTIMDYRALNSTAMYELALKAATAKAADIFKSEFIGHSSVPVGKRFTHEKVEYMTVCVAKSGLHVIRIHDGAWRSWPDKIYSAKLVYKYKLAE